MPDSYVQRAELLADLGRYDEAAEELEQGLAEHPSAPAYTLLARVKLASGALRDALTAADAAVAASPADLEANVARGMVLAELRQVDEAVAQAERILRQGRGDGYACTSAAAILAEVRSGQVALDAAWEGVRLSPDQPRAHLVLGVVAARLGLTDIAQRAYREALELDPQLTEGQAALGVVRLEQHRYAAALSQLAGAEGGARRPAAALPQAQVPDQPRGELRRLLRYAAAYALIAPVLVACAGTGSGARTWALVLAGAGWAGVWLGVSRMAPQARAQLAELLRADRTLRVATSAVVAAPAFLLLFTLLGAVWPLFGTFAAGVLAFVTSRRGRVPPDVE